MTTINFTEQDLIELRCILNETPEFKMTKSMHSGYSEEEIKGAEEYLIPLFRKLGMYN
jgi:hypothetical protein